MQAGSGQLWGKIPFAKADLVGSTLPSVTRAFKRPSAAGWALGGILLLGLILRLWGIKTGLPLVYHLDEYAHFTVSAVEMFRDGLNPNYFQNPPAFTYLLHALFSIAYGVSPIGDSGESIQRAFDTDPTTLYLIARITSAVMGIGASLALYFCGKRLFGTAVALAAAAFLTFTFLPVHYGHFALNDVPMLLPLCVGLLGLAGISKRGKPIDYVVAGLGLGLATATKYTAAALAVAIFAAWAIRFYDDREQGKREFIWLAAAAGVSLIVFVIANPFSVIDAKSFYYGVKRQSDLSSSVSKLGTDDVSGWVYYVKTLVWGYGIVPFGLSIAGAILMLKREWRTALPLVIFTLLVWLFMGKQLRFYARWLLPIYPALAIFSAYAAIEAGKKLAELIKKTPSPRAITTATVAVVVIALAGSLIHVIHNDRVLSREDTRDLAKSWIIENVPRDEKIVFELIGPRPYYNENGARKGDPAFEIQELPRGTEVEKYASTLRPELIDQYTEAGFCWVVVGSIQKGRVTKAPEKMPEAAAYYKALDERAERVASFSPMKPGKALPTFNFDISYNYYPLSYKRPGPQIDVYRLSGGSCRP